MIPRTKDTGRRSLQALAALSCAAIAACGPATDPQIWVGSDAPVGAGVPVEVALLVPAESGIAEYDILAKEVENGARLAIHDMQGVEIDLRVYATAARPDGAADAAVQAVNDGAKIILGPIYSGPARAAGTAISSNGVNVLSLSNNTDIAGGNVFVLGNTFENVADRLVTYAVENDLSRIFVVYGQGEFEERGFAAISAAIDLHGAELVGSASFEWTQNAVVEAAPQIAAAVEHQKAEAIFLTSGNAGALPILSQLIVENGVDPQTTQLIGLQRWDIPSSALEHSPLQGGWFALPDRRPTLEFNARYSSVYGGQPNSFMASIAYDGIALIGALVSSSGSRSLSVDVLTNPTGFAGINGVFRLRPDGTNERGLAVATIFEKRVAIIDPAPASFGVAGF